MVKVLYYLFFGWEGELRSLFLFYRANFFFGERFDFSIDSLNVAIFCQELIANFLKKENALAPFQPIC